VGEILKYMFNIPTIRPVKSAIKRLLKINLPIPFKSVGIPVVSKLKTTCPTKSPTEIEINVILK
jgi:hypothetical protein